MVAASVAASAAVLVEAQSRSKSNRFVSTKLSDETISIATRPPMQSSERHAFQDSNLFRHRLSAVHLSTVAHKFWLEHCNKCTRMRCRSQTGFQKSGGTFSTGP
eukprot:TRINITY_DN14640_c0_g1_i1.p3 TRINITY_DN14640_c0_g1~~TRINITY_DN14640_c0_g1_i1.p3  ORF type:complete len:121 (-),score=17.92 TRINITY_DN14640_c0_g1_i1:516-827(-)